MKNGDNFFGATVLGKKGQVVVPMEVRKKMLWKEGDKMLFFGLRHGMVVLTKLDHIKEFTNRIEKKLAKIKQFVK